jgi:hypothetical protein
MAPGRSGDCRTVRVKWLVRRPRRTRCRRSAVADGWPARAKITGNISTRRMLFGASLIGSGAHDQSGDTALMRSGVRSSENLAPPVATAQCSGAVRTRPELRGALRRSATYSRVLGVPLLVLGHPRGRGIIIEASRCPHTLTAMIEALTPLRGCRSHVFAT